jgi:hypothetical protein
MADQFGEISVACVVFHITLPKKKLVAQKNELYRHVSTSTEIFAKNKGLNYCFEENMAILVSSTKVRNFYFFFKKILRATTPCGVLRIRLHSPHAEYIILDFSGDPFTGT